MNYKYETIVILFCENFETDAYVNFPKYRKEVTCPICGGKLISKNEINKKLSERKNLSKLDQKRLEFLLDEPRLYEGRVITYRELPVTERSAYRREYARKKRNCNYAKLKTPIIEYALIMGKDAIFVPKMVWDYFLVPIR